MVSGGRAAELKDRIHSGQEDRRVGRLHFKTKLKSVYFLKNQNKTHLAKNMLQVFFCLDK